MLRSDDPSTRIIFFRCKRALRERMILALGWSYLHVNGLPKLKVSFLRLSGLVQTTPVKVKNAALFLRFGLPSTLLRHDSGSCSRSFSKTLFEPEDFKLKRRLCVWTRADGGVFENGALRKRWRYENHVIFLAGVSSNTNPTRPAIVALLISPTYSADRKDLMHFRSENTVFKFLRWVHQASECL